MTCCSLLNTDHLVICQIIRTCDIGIFRNDDYLNTGCIAIREIYILFTLVSDSHACQRHVSFSCCDRRDNGIKINIIYFQLFAHCISNCLCNLDIDTFVLLSIYILIWRECCVGCHNQCITVRCFCCLCCCASVFCIGTAVICAATCCHGKYHCCSCHQGYDFLCFHIFSPLYNPI